MSPESPEDRCHCEWWCGQNYQTARTGPLMIGRGEPPYPSYFAWLASLGPDAVWCTPLCRDEMREYFSCTSANCLEDNGPHPCHPNGPHPPLRERDENGRLVHSFVPTPATTESPYEDVGAPDCIPGGVHQPYCRDAGKPVTTAESPWAELTRVRAQLERAVELFRKRPAKPLHGSARNAEVADFLADIAPSQPEPVKSQGGDEGLGMARRINERIASTSWDEIEKCPACLGLRGFDARGNPVADCEPGRECGMCGWGTK